MGILALDRFFGFGYFMSWEGMERGKLTEDSVPRDTRDVGKHNQKPTLRATKCSTEVQILRTRRYGGVLISLSLLCSIYKQISTVARSNPGIHIPFS